MNFAKVELGRLFIPAEVEHRRNVVLLGNGPWQSLFPNIDPIGKKVRIGTNEFTVIGVLGKRPSPGGFSTDVDDFAIIPYGTYEKFYGKVLKGSAKISAGNFNPAVFRTAMIAVVPRAGMRESAMREVEAMMRIRHRLKLDEPNDFDLATQDAVLKVWEQISQATFLALVVISSIALMVGGIGVMAIMMISVTERTREIGVRKALGARRREILWQFLIEAVFLTSVGGVLGIFFGSSIGLLVHCAFRLPGLAAVVVLRPRHRLLGQRRHLLRAVPGDQSVEAGSDRSVEIRVASSSQFQLPVPSSQLPVASRQFPAEPARVLLSLPAAKRRPNAGLQKAVRVAESSQIDAGPVRQILRSIWRIGRPGQLRGQLHGAAISVPSNIAEGAGRGSNSDFRRFCFYSLGSINELEYDLLLAKDLRFLPVELHDRRGEQLREVRRMLTRFAQTLEAST